MRINNSYDLLFLIDSYITYLKKHNWKFTSDGFPVFEKKMFLDEYPLFIVPYSHRNDRLIIDKKHTVLCTYNKDTAIFPRLYKLFDEIEIYKEYMGVISGDLSVTSDMDDEWQDLLMLLNQLYTAILACNGVKILLNSRCGSVSSLKNFNHFPHNIMIASGFLGCSKSQKYDYDYLSKILKILPSKIVIYGKNDNNVNEQLDMFNIKYRYYDDFHKISKNNIL